MALSHSPLIVTNGLVLCLDAGNTRSYPGSGTTITDLSGLTNNGTLVGSPTISGGVITLNGTNQNISTNYTQTSVTQYTIDVWFKTTSGTATFVENRGSGAGKSLKLGIGPANGTAGVVWMGLNTDNYLTQIGTTTTFNDGNWHNAVGTFNQPSGSVSTSSYGLYMDGKVATTTTAGMLQYQIAIPTVPVSGLGGTNIGVDPLGNVWFNGTLGPCKIYTRALTAAEIQQNFNALRGRFGV